MEEEQEFKKLKIENARIRDKIEDILKEYLSVIDDNYLDLWELINDLVNNEIEQESYCGY